MSFLLTYQYIAISTHAPLAGRDTPLHIANTAIAISTHAPLAGRDPATTVVIDLRQISTHAPLAGRDLELLELLQHLHISTHAPLAGRDGLKYVKKQLQSDFNPRAPCGARLLVLFVL